MRRPANRFSYSRAFRLEGVHAYAAVLAHKCSVAGEMFRVYAKPNGAVDARIGIIVSKRVIPQAVARNYCKRLAREVFRTERETLAGVDLVVRANAAVPRALSGTARAEIRDLLRRARRQCCGTAMQSH